MIEVIKNKPEAMEEELLSEDGIFARKYSTVYDNAEKCCQCGYPIIPGEQALQIYCNGDVIHKECWLDYAEENTQALCKSFVIDELCENDY